MIDIKKATIVSYGVYLSSFIFLIIRYFKFRRPLGYGLGDAMYLFFFSSVLIVVSLLFIINIKKQGKNFNRWIVLISVVFSIYIFLTIYVWYGSEVAYHWKIGDWKW
jgi:hypothetical protein